jgi:hypothetical protein
MTDSTLENRVVDAPVGVNAQIISTDRPRFAEARRVEIEQRLAELERFSKRFKASRRRFRLRSFISWQMAAAERRKRRASV